MKILIDADGCPVVDITVNLGRKYNINTIIMCDTSHIINKVGVDTVVLSKGSDSVDFALVNKVSKGDIVVTQDYGCLLYTSLCHCHQLYPLYYYCYHKQNYCHQPFL